MAYETTNPPRLLVPGVSGSPNIWIYVDGDPTATVDASGYFTNGYALGMRDHDQLLLIDTNLKISSWHYVEVSGTTVDLADGTTVGSTTNSGLRLGVAPCRIALFGIASAGALVYITTIRRGYCLVGSAVIGGIDDEFAGKRILRSYDRVRNALLDSARRPRGRQVQRSLRSDLLETSREQVPPGHLIRMRRVDGQWDVMVSVVSQAAGGLVVELWPKMPSVEDLESADSERAKALEPRMVNGQMVPRVDHTPATKWRVIGLDGNELSRGHATKAKAEEALRTYAASLGKEIAVA